MESEKLKKSHWLFFITITFLFFIIGVYVEFWLIFSYLIKGECLHSLREVLSDYNTPHEAAMYVLFYVLIAMPIFLVIPVIYIFTRIGIYISIKTLDKF